MPTLSVILITKNEEEDLPRALRSVAWADQIVVVDN
ncbi:MAG: glycosyltransferase family 2 protein, partial [Betaproteobacteria bacterium]|nr:glycosyltransferase family 2 protein [Betaproteobacteria bacterium]